MTATQVRILKDGETACGIYFLLSAGSIVYVGQSIDISRRIETHRKTTMVFDEVKIIEVERDDLDAMERKFILEFKPERNGTVRDGKRDYCAPSVPVSIQGGHMTARQLQKLLDGAGLTQRAAAKALEIHERTMRKYCAGDSAVPKVVEYALLYIASQSSERAS